MEKKARTNNYVSWIGIPPRVNPCVQSCPNRSPTCHAECEKYVEYKRLLAERHKEINAEKEYRDVRARNWDYHARWSISEGHYVKRNGR